MRGVPNQSLWLGLQRRKVIATAPPPSPVVLGVQSVSTSVIEGQPAVFMITLSAAPTTPVMFSYSWGGGAVVGTHYTLPPSMSHGVTFTATTITVPPGVSQFFITVSTIDNALYTGDIPLTLTVGGQTGSVMILENDPVPAPLDGFPHSFLTGAFALRRLFSAHTGPLIRVRRSSDNAELDIGFLPNNSLDIPALLAFVGSGDGFVVRWYRQHPNVTPQAPLDPLYMTPFNDALGTRQPRIVTNGQVHYLPPANTEPAIWFSPAPAPHAKNLVSTLPINFGITRWAFIVAAHTMVAPPASFPYYSRLLSYVTDPSGSDVSFNPGDWGALAAVQIRTLGGTRIALTEIADQWNWILQTYHLLNMSLIPVADNTAARYVFMSYEDPFQNSSGQYALRLQVGTTNNIIEPVSFIGWNSGLYFRIGGQTEGWASELEQWSGFVSCLILGNSSAHMYLPASAEAMIDTVFTTIYGV